MVAPTDLRSTIQQIKTQLPSIQKDNTETNMVDLIKLIGKAKPSDKTGIRWAYQHLGLWNELKYSYEKQSQIQQSGLNKAEANHQIAIIEKCRGDNASIPLFIQALQFMLKKLRVYIRLKETSTQEMVT